MLPLEHATSITTWKRQVARVGERLDEEAHHRLSRQPALNEFDLPTRNPPLNGAHRLLQVSARVLNQQLRGDFERWHPELRTAAYPVRLAA